MDEETVDQTIVFAEIIRDQFQTLISVFSRPVVQRQALAIIVILALAWLLTWLIKRWLRRSDLEREVSDAQQQRRRWLTALGRLIAPLVTLGLLRVITWFFEWRDYPNGLLVDTQSLILFWLVYSIFLMLLYARFGEAMRPYQHRFMTPIFLIFVVREALRIIPGFAAFGAIPIAIGSISVTLIDLLEGIIVLYLFFVGAWVTEKILNKGLPSRLDAEPGVIQSVSTLMKYFIIGVGILVAFAVWGLDASSLALIAGGLSVGIGIGLQDIVADFVSGFVLLFEQTLRPGDVIEIDGKISEVERISLRTSTVRTLNNEEVIVPNATFTREAVKTLTKTERLFRVLVPLGVSFDSDPQQVQQLAEESARKHPLVLPDPAPALLFRGYGDSSLDFELAAWINRPEKSPFVKSDLFYSLWSELKEQGIEVPFPQRDLNLRKGWEKLSTDLQTT
jgi:potassium efflux system protein